MIRLLLVLTTLFNFFLSGCTNKNDDYYYSSEVYHQAQKQLQEKKFSSAIKKLDLIYKNYLFSKYHEQSKLDLIYAYYKNAEFNSANYLVNLIIQKNPNHSNIDYLLYLKGLININTNGSNIQRMLNIDLSDKDNNYIIEAFNSFFKILKYYKNSQYNNISKKYLVFLKELLAFNELKIINFYVKKHAYIAVTNRILELLKKYPDTKSTFIAMQYLNKINKNFFSSNELDNINNTINNISK